MGEPGPRLDHLIYGTRDLAASVEQLERDLGVRPTPGGQHIGEGTHNALLALGPSSYLEVIAPDPGQPEPNQARWLGIDGVTTPQLVAWVAKGQALDRVVEEARHRGVALGDVISASRIGADGSRLSWQVTNLHDLVEDGLVPFFIDWGETVHPASTAAQGIRLRGLRAEHPDPRRIRKMLEGLGFEIPVRLGQSPQLIATLETPRGVVELR